MNKRWKYLKEAFLETLSEYYCRFLLPSKIIESRKSRYQNIDVVDYNGNKALMLDGFIQFHESDEFVYHEMAVHLPMSYHKNPEKILVLGGGDGILLRELLKYKSVKKITLIDIDEEVIEVSKKHFAHIHKNSFEDPRVEIRVEDALKFVDDTEEKYDVIIMDLVDPFGFGEKLYTKDAIRRMARPLKEDGIFATHVEDAWQENYTAVKLFIRIRESFKHAKLATAYIKSFEGLWGFVVMSNNELIVRNKEVPETRYFEKDRISEYTNPPKHLRKAIERFEKEGFEKLAEIEPVAKKVNLDQTIEEILKPHLEH